MSKEDNNPFAQSGIKLNRDELRLHKALPEGEFRKPITNGDNHDANTPKA
jgi:hypothetical protein